MGTDSQYSLKFKLSKEFMKYFSSCEFLKNYAYGNHIVKAGHMVKAF